MPDDVDTQSEVAAQAADWFARLRAEDRTQNDEADFRLWLEASPLHRQAFARLNDVWDLAGGLEDLRSAPQTRKRLDRRLVLTGLAGAAALTGIGFWAGSGRRVEARVLETGVGEIRTLTLRDGSELSLDTRTRATVQDMGRDRQLVVEQGRIRLVLAPSAAGTFAVRAGRMSVRSGDATLNISHMPGGSEAVFLERGSASVRLSREVRDLNLVSGQRITLPADGDPTVDAPDPLGVAQWTTGFAVFDDIPLAEAAEEIARYSMTPIRTDAAAGALRLSGRFRLGDAVAFAEAVELVLPVQVRREEGGVVVTGSGAGAG